MKEQDRIWYLTTKKLDGEATEKELEELQVLLKKYPDMTYSFDLLSDLRKPAPDMEPAEVEAAYNRHLQRMAAQEVGFPSGNDASKQKPTPPVWKQQSKTPMLAFLNSNGRLANYFKVTCRTLARSKVFSFINITGLAIGMASAILILLWIQNELSYDQFHAKKDRIYQLYSRAVFDGQLASWGSTPMVMAPVLKMNYPEVEEATRVNWVAAFILKRGDKQLQTQGFLTDPGFLTMFDFPLVKGNAKTALATTHSIVVTEKLANKLFGHEDAMGKVIRIDSNALFTVTGIMKDLPNNTSFEFEYLVPWSYMKEVGWDNPDWAVTSIVRTYVLVKPGVSEATINNHFRNIIKTHAPDIQNEIFVHPMRKWRLWSRFENGVVAGGYIETVRMFGFIAVFILLIACINYMNLGTARSVKRAKEVGIRKVVGAGKGSLIGQFLCESILFSFIAGMIALVIVEPSFGWFNELTGKKLFIPYTNPYFWLSALGFILFTGVIAGSYPAFYLSAFKPIPVLKGTFKNVRTLVTPRKLLVVLQFTFAIVLIISTIVIYRQIVHGMNRDAGFNMDNLVYVYNKGDVEKNYGPIRNALLRSGAVTDVARTSCPITEVWSSDDTYEWEGKDKNIRTFCIKSTTDQNFVKTMGLHLTAGRDIDTERYPTDSTAVLLNESAVKQMGFKNPIGQTIRNKEATWHVVGVIKNYIAGIPYEPLYPMVIQGPGNQNWFGTLTFKLNGNHKTSDNLAKIGAIFKQYNPDYPFDYYFVDEAYDYKFEYEWRSGKLAALFAGLTIFISCLGLFALAVFMAESRVKEIGVRKVLGASVAAITTLLSKEFLQLVIISFVLASPLAWWAMHRWLQHYSYRVDISWWVFGVTGLLSVLIALATVSYQAVKAALANPVKALRSD
jgi:putative ABC transport system permease protein